MSICVHYLEWVYWCNVVESKKEASKEPQAGPSGLQRDVKNKNGILFKPYL